MRNTSRAARRPRREPSEQGATRKVYAPANDNYRMPANDNTGLPVTTPGQLKRAEKLAKQAFRTVNKVDDALRLIEYIKRQATNGVGYHLPGYPGINTGSWEVLRYCTPSPLTYNYSDIRGWARFGSAAGACLRAQAVSTFYWPTPYTGSGNNYLAIRNMDPVTVRHASVMDIRKRGTVVPAPQPGYMPAPYQPVPQQALNPNVARNLPRIVPRPRPVRDVPSLLNYVTAPEQGINPQFQRGHTTAISVGARTQPRLAPAVKRAPPPPDVSEGKFITKSARVGIALYKALDGISEAAEIVDAVYDALPDDVKRRWGRNRPTAAFLDQAGQYGIDGADWKLRAIYYNVDKIDGQKAVTNIIKNHLEDKVIGGMQRWLPRNSGAAHEGGEKAVAEVLKNLGL